MIDPQKRLTAQQARQHPFFTNKPSQEPMDVSHVDPAHEYVVRKAQHMYRNYGAPAVQKVPLNECGGGNFEHVGSRGILSKSPKYSPPKEGEGEGGDKDGDDKDGDASERSELKGIQRDRDGSTPPPFPTTQARGGGGPDIAVSAPQSRKSVRVVDLGALGQPPASVKVKAEKSSDRQKNHRRRLVRRRSYRRRRVVQPCPTAPRWASMTSSPNGPRTDAWASAAGGSRPVGSTRPSPKRL